MLLGVGDVKAQEFPLLPLYYEIKNAPFLDVTDLAVEGIYNTYSSYLMNPDGTGKPAASSLNLILNVDLLKYLFIESRIISMTDDDQFRKVGLEYKTGIHLGPYIDIFYAHLSHHVLEQTSNNRFDQYDGFGFRINFIKKRKD